MPHTSHSSNSLDSLHTFNPIGAHCSGYFLTQKWFYLALLFAPLSLSTIAFIAPNLLQHQPWHWPAWFILIVWQPVLEELIFRGLIQQKLTHQAWLTRFFNTNTALNTLCIGGISAANLVTSLLFTSLHFLYHPPLLALGVLVPSLIFGWFFDRYHCVVPAILLHSVYNAVLLFSFF
ncbi:JDVT-CTERM system glutamic-type intramembrane protease MrtJ [Thiomicrorhabdus aquaedulcis]|uniref:JDVT-CTERM system glutamic-type intramembrane protease MrtJ n=1 Tax=Thiomicrorhabdus aquaedulcis TaxID=2211106 RepID=UPI000FD71C12|nr:JDVT-CTERM system glutamic-type intramembrane protease [Thiomicrorhabdus aquaedulcis]